MSATGNELVKLSQLRGTINGLRTDLQSANLTNTNTSIIQTTGGSLAIKDGQELVKKVEGQSYVANQLVTNGNMSSLNYWNADNGTKSVANNVLTFVANENVNNKSLAYSCPSLYNNVVMGHKYLQSFYYKSDQNFNWQNLYTSYSIASSNTFLNKMAIVTYSNASHQTQYFYNYLGITSWNLQLMNFNTVDLTTHFGGNSNIPSAILNMTTLDTTLLANYGIKLDGVYQAPTLCSSNNEYKNIGRNLWDEEWELGKYNITTGEKEVNTIRIRCTNLIPVFPNTTYYFKAPTNKELLQYDINGKFIYYSGQDASNTTFTTRSDCYYITFVMYTAYGTTYNHDIMIGIGDSVPTTNPEPYQSNLLSYNGTLERKVGAVDLGSLNWVQKSGATSVFRAEISNIVRVNSEIIINALCPNYLIQYSAYSGSITDSSSKGIYKSRDNSGANDDIYIVDTTYTDAQAFKTAMSGVYLYYELATPTTEEIVNATNVELKGVGTAKDTLYNESGLASWKNGLTEQVNKNGIVAIPYSVSEEFAVSINGQLQHNLEVDKSQQEEIQELTSRMYFTETSTNNPAQLYGGNWTQVGTTTIGTTTIYCWKKGE